MHHTAEIFNIQRFSLHDGPGIRTTVFFKGCPLRCLWCSNPESQSMAKEWGWDEERCEPDGICPLNCPHLRRGIEDPLGSYRETCPTEAWIPYGDSMSLDEVEALVLKDLPFFEESGGGVTLSGGEVLFQSEFAKSLLQRLKASGVHTAVETTGFATKAAVDAVATHCDLWLFDLKHHDNDRHRKFTGQDMGQILENLAYIWDRCVPLELRIPVIPGVNNTLEDAERFVALIQNTLTPRPDEESGQQWPPITLLPFHQFGQKKYDLLGKEYTFSDVAALQPEDLDPYASILRTHSFAVTV